MKVAPYKKVDEGMAEDIAESIYCIIFNFFGRGRVWCTMARI
jgi:hypothetical protein